MRNHRLRPGLPEIKEDQEYETERDRLPDILLHGGSRVSPENLTGVPEWYQRAR